MGAESRAEFRVVVNYDNIILSVMFKEIDCNFLPRSSRYFMALEWFSCLSISLHVTSIALGYHVCYLLVHSRPEQDVPGSAFALFNA